ncbi:MAG: zinc finger domain-containing protein [Nostoc sp.]
MELLDSADALQKLKYTAQTEDWVIGVVNADGEKCVGKAYTKCDRCWNYSIRMGESAEHPLICDRCVAALEGV